MGNFFQVTEKAAGLSPTNIPPSSDRRSNILIPKPPPISEQAKKGVVEPMTSGQKARAGRRAG